MLPPVGVEKSNTLLSGLRNIFTGFFCFHVVKPLMSIVALLPTFCNYEKTSIGIKPM